MLDVLSSVVVGFVALTIIVALLMIAGFLISMLAAMFAAPAEHHRQHGAHA